MNKFAVGLLIFTAIASAEHRAGVRPEAPAWEVVRSADGDFACAMPVRPTSETRNRPCQRSFPWLVMGASAHASAPTRRDSSTSERMSCPSAKMSAVTTTSSSTVRLIGNRPPSISGPTFSMMTRDGARSRPVALPVFAASGSAMQSPPSRSFRPSPSGQPVRLWSPRAASATGQSSKNHKWGRKACERRHFSLPHR